MNNNNIIVPPSHQHHPNQPSNQSISMSPQMMAHMNHMAQQDHMYQAHIMAQAQAQMRAQQAEAEVQARMRAHAQAQAQAQAQARALGHQVFSQRTISQSSSCTATPIATPLITPRATPMSTPTPEETKIKQLMGKILGETFLVDGDQASEWASRAIRSVVKTTKKYKCFDEFHDAIMSASSQSRCCPGRNDKQPGGFGRSNMFFLKLFRFPWLRWNVQIESIRYCRYQFDNDREKRQVCLNPYHYKWISVDKEPIPPIVVNKYGSYGIPPVRPEDPRNDWIVAEQNMSAEERSQYHETPNITMRGDEIRMLYEPAAFDPKDPLDDFPMPAPTDIQSNMALGNMGTHSNFSFPPKLNFEEDKGEDETFNYQSGLSSPASDMAFSPDVFIPAQNSQVAVLFQSHGNVEEQAKKAPEEKKVEEQKAQEPMEQEDPKDAPPDPSELEFESIPAELTPLQSIASTDDSEKSLSPVISADAMEDDSDKGDEEMMDLDDEDEARSPKRPKISDDKPTTPCEPKPLYRSSPAELGALVRAAGTYECVEYEQTDHWLGLFYNEESDQVGEYRVFRRNHCLIDGYMAFDEEPSRFSLGFISNPTRAQIVSEVRSMIGKGCRMYLLAGEVYVENLSPIPIFVQSISANMKNGFKLNTVNKLPPKSTMKVFDMKIFSRALRIAAEKTYNDVFALTRMCTIRISFCKGWGVHYRRSTILRTPVWLQAHFYGPMKWIDSVLHSMGAPPRECSSRS